MGKQFLASSTMHDLCKVFNVVKQYEERKVNIEYFNQNSGNVAIILLIKTQIIKLVGKLCFTNYDLPVYD